MDKTDSVFKTNPRLTNNRIYADSALLPNPSLNVNRTEIAMDDTADTGLRLNPSLNINRMEAVTRDTRANRGLDINQSEAVTRDTRANRRLDINESEAVVRDTRVNPSLNINRTTIQSVEDGVTSNVITVVHATPEASDELPSFLANDSILPLFVSDDSDLPSFRPRSFSTTAVLAHFQVARDLRSISDSFNSLYDKHTNQSHLSDEDDGPSEQQMSRRASMPNMGRQRRSSLLGAILDRYVPANNHLQPLQPMHSHPQARSSTDTAREDRELRLSQGSSVDGEDRREESWAEQYRRGRDEGKARIGSVPEDDDYEYTDTHAVSQSNTHHVNWT